MITEKLMQAQIDLELDMHGAGVDRFYKNNDRAIMADSNSDTDWSRRIITQLVDPMAAGIIAYYEYYSKKRGTKPVALHKIKQAEPHRAAYITIKIIMDALGSSKFDANWVVTQLGRKIEDQIRFTNLEDAAPKYIARIKESLAQRASSNYEHQHKVMVATERKLVEEEERKAELKRWSSWSEAECKHVGAVLVNIFEKAVTFEGQPIIRREIRSMS